MSSQETAIQPYAVTIGTRPDNDLVFDLPTVSGRHAQLVWEVTTGRWLLEDLGSTNGTYLHGNKVLPGQPVPVQLGDAVYLGKKFHFVLNEGHFQKRQEQGVVVEPAAAPTVEAVQSVAPSSAGPAATIVIDAAAAIPEKTTQPLGDEGQRATFDPQQTLAEPSPDGGRTTDPMLAGRRRRRRLATTGSQEIDPDSPRLTMAAPGIEEQAFPAALNTEDPPPAEAPALSIGYADDNLVQIKNPAVSGYHAKLYRVESWYVLEDQGSTNGTWFAGQRISRVKLSEQDQFSLGNYTLNVSDLLGYFAQSGVAGHKPTTHRPPVIDRPVQLGRSPDCDVHLDAPMVSSYHAKLTPLPGGTYRLEDLKSTNGTFVNSRENRVKVATVGPDDVVFLGSYRLPLSRLASLLPEKDEEQELVIPTGKKVMVIGRGKSADIILKTPQVSRKHAELRVLDDGRLELRDLGGINGTYVNGRRIKSCIVTPRDLISFADFRVRLDISAGRVLKDYHGDITVQAERVTVQVKDKRSDNGVKTIVDNASFTAYPTEFVGLMGPSGAGKTTLMMALNGYTQPSQGRSLINGLDLYASYDSFRGNIGYVPQDDIIYPELTVFESLYYTAKLRLPPDTSDREIIKRIDDILEKLEIQQTRDVPVGDAIKKGISGGQRKRVNLAQELLTEPALLFLDEPTSGLASEDTINVMNLLRRLADEGRTILLTIHQPSLEAYRKLDTVIYLFHGRLVYYGPTYPDSLLYFHQDVRVGTPEADLVLSDPGNCLKVLAEDQRSAMEQEQPWETLNQVVETRRNAFLGSDHYKDFVYDRALQRQERSGAEAKERKRKIRQGWVRQWWILTRRCLTIKRKDTVNTAILLLQAPIIGMVLWLVFSGRLGSYFDQVNRGPAALFLLVASAVWFGCSNSAREIVGEQAIYKRERMVNLMIPSYVASKFTVLGAVCAVQCAILLGIVYPALHFEGSLIQVYLILLLSSMAGVGMGLTLSAVVRSTEAAIALVPLLLIPQIILGGVIMPVHELNPPMQLLSATMVTRWGYEGLLHIEFGDDDIDTIRERCGIDVCPDPLAFESQAGDDSDTPGATLVSAFGDIPDQSYFPAGEGVGEDICTVLCANALRGNEVTPLERAFGLDLHRDASMRQGYAEQYKVGRQGAQTSAEIDYGVLLLFNLLLFGLVGAILRVKDGDVG